MKDVIVTTTLGFLLCSLMAVGCSQRHTDSDTERRIELRSVLSTVSSSASRSNSDEQQGFASSVVGWEVSGSQPDYTQSPTWYSKAIVSPASTVSSIELVPEQFYNENTAIKTHIRAWYPAVDVVSDGQVVFPANSSIKDGELDVLLADEIWATSTILPSGALHFKHMLSQIKFNIVCDVDYATLGDRLTSITVKGAELPLGLNLASNLVVYKPAGDLLVPGIAVGGAAITGTPIIIGSPIMVRPFAGNSFKVDILTAQSLHTDIVVTINNDAQFVVGKSYLITLRFTGRTKKVSVSSSFDEWVAGSTGYGYVN